MNPNAWGTLSTTSFAAVLDPRTALTQIDFSSTSYLRRYLFFHFFSGTSFEPAFLITELLLFQMLLLWSLHSKTGHFPKSRHLDPTFSRKSPSHLHFILTNKSDDGACFVANTLTLMFFSIRKPSFWSLQRFVVRVRRKLAMTMTVSVLLIRALLAEFFQTFLATLTIPRN